MQADAISVGDPGTLERYRQLMSEIKEKDAADAALTLDLQNLKVRSSWGSQSFLRLDLFGVSLCFLGGPPSADTRSKPTASTTSMWYGIGDIPPRSAMFLSRI